MNKKVFLERWLDWTLAIILVTFIGVWGEVQKFAIEQDVVAADAMAVASVQIGNIRSAR